MTCTEGQDTEVEGTPCADTVCKCRSRDCYVPDGDFCRKEVRECDLGEELLHDGMCCCQGIL